MEKPDKRGVCVDSWQFFLVAIRSFEVAKTPRRSSIFLPFYVLSLTESLGIQWQRYKILEAVLFTSCFGHKQFQVLFVWSVGDI